MRYFRTIAALLSLAMPAIAQADADTDEIIVTAGRRTAESYEERMPAIGLRRLADFAVQPVVITGDTRDEGQRHDEIFRMIRGAIELAAKRGGIEIAIGDETVETLTLANYRSVTLTSDRRPDANKVTTLVKTRLSAETDAKAALDRITAFIKAVPPVGRSQMEADGDLTLSVVRPDQYRAEIVRLIAADAAANIEAFGADYALTARGVERPVEWTRASLTDVLLYIPYELTVVPKPR